MGINRIIEIDFGRCFKAIAKYSKQILVTTLVFLFLGFGAANILVGQEDGYTATSSVYSIVYGSYSESAESLQVMIAYADIVKSHKVAERAALLLGDERLDTETIYDMISAEYDASTYNYSSIITIHADSNSRDISVKVVNAVAEAFVLEIASLTGKEDVKQLDRAYDATISYNASATKIQTIALVTLLGIVAACGFVFIREIFSLKMYKPKDVTLYGQLNLLGIVPKFK